MEILMYIHQPNPPSIDMDIYKNDNKQQKQNKGDQVETNCNQTKQNAVNKITGRNSIHV
jgi:hypothetical protein